jgi:hypothetical protein
MYYQISTTSIAHSIASKAQTWTWSWQRNVFDCDVYSCKRNFVATLVNWLGGGGGGITIYHFYQVHSFPWVFPKMKNKIANWYFVVSFPIVANKFRFCYRVLHPVARNIKLRV